MKAKIAGVVYDTDTAEKLYTYWNGLCRSDINYVGIDFYRTPGGEFFLYADQSGTICVDGAPDELEIGPMSREEFLEFALHLEVYDEVMTAMGENNTETGE